MGSHGLIERGEVSGAERSRRRGRWLCGLLLAVLTTPLGAGAPMVMTVSPAMSMGPTNVRVRVRIEPHASNRELKIAVDSGEFYRSSVITLDGENSQRTVVVDYPRLLGGEYLVSGTLSDGEGHVRARVTRDVIVLAPGLDR